MAALRAGSTQPAEVPPSFRLERARRIRRRGDFVRVQGAGARVGARHFLLLVLRRAEPGPGRLGIVASRKIGGAVQRNRAKRLVREAVRRHPGLLPEGVDVVVIVRPGAHALRLADVDAELAGLGRLIAKRAGAQPAR
jgi:ribonuclease P protein component